MTNRLFIKWQSLFKTAGKAIRRPRILLLVDRRGWAFDHSAKQLARFLESDFQCDIRYVRECPKIRAKNYDLLYVYFWGETSYREFGFVSDRIIKQLSSHRWEDDARYGPCTPAELASRHLGDAAAVFCTSLRLRDQVAPFHPRVYHITNGVNPDQFRPVVQRTGEMKIGWAGNSTDRVKGYHDILLPACQDRFSLSAAVSLPHQKMNDFYNGVDVFVVASKHEGEPLTLIEAMAAGCFPVCTDVGIVPELIRSGENGLIVSSRTAGAFRRAFEWCERHLDDARRAGLENAERIRNERIWRIAAKRFKDAFVEVLEAAREPNVL